MGDIKYILKQSSKNSSQPMDVNQNDIPHETQVVKVEQIKAVNGVSTSDNTQALLNQNQEEQQIDQTKRVLPPWIIACASSTSDANEFKNKAPKAKKKYKIDEEGPSCSYKQQTVKLKEEESTVNLNQPHTSESNECSGDENANDKRSLKPTKKQANRRNSKDPDISDHSDDSINDLDNDPETKPKIHPSTKKNSSAKRKSCQFGGKCYRKNPAHFEECCHPGDDDYNAGADAISDEDGDSNDDRPECEYGTDCYRNNPEHKKKYKHTKRPQRAAARKAKRKRTMKDGSSDEGSYDGSFIDDDSDDYNPLKDDAYYSPDEDLKELKREAQNFMQNKKLYKMND